MAKAPNDVPLTSTSSTPTGTTSTGQNPSTMKMKKTLPTVHQLRKMNIKVRVSHLRLWYRFDPKTGQRIETVKHHLDVDVNDWTQSHFGGTTEIRLSDEHGIEYTGTAECYKKDRYIRKVGVMKALARAYSMWYEVNQNFN